MNIFNKNVCILFAVVVFQFGPLCSQTFELGIGINKTHLWQPDNSLSNFHRKEKLGLNISLRFQDTQRDLFLNNCEFGLDYSRGDFQFQEHRSPGGAGGESVQIEYQTLAVFFNNYFLNFGTLNKGFQFSLGLHTNYNLRTGSYGYYTSSYYAYDSMYKMYHFFGTSTSLNGVNNSHIRKFNFGVCMSIGFREFIFHSRRFRCRYDIYNCFIPEIKHALYMYDLRQRFTLNILI